jgi:hypothetical protein
MISLQARRAGRIQLSFAVTATGALTTFFGAGTQCTALTPAGGSLRHGPGGRGDG